ncbi:MAG: hypothetical protein JEZ00_00700 [Anaerolineaceae bacterium]|nr:hypothetical protein [Anaerolineaceae bacterium]
MAQADLTRVASNIGALNSLWALQNINRQLGIHQTRLSTGKRINSAADDPAGLTIATKLKSRSEGLSVALGNIGDAKNLLAVAEGGIGRITDIIIAMKNKAAQAASDTMGSEERAAIKEQLTAYAAQIDDIVDQTTWNSNGLIDGTYDSTAMRFQTGADAADTTTLDGLINLRASAGGTGTSLELASVTGTATSAIGAANNGATLLTTAADGTINDNLSALSSGSYTVRITMVAGGGAATDDKIELLDASGSPQLIATAADGSGAVAFESPPLNLDGVTSYDFGNGLSVTWAAKGDTASVQESTVSVVAADTYDLTTTGGQAGGLALDSAERYSDLMTYLESKLTTVNTMMSKVGAFTGRLTFKEDQVMASQINVEASYNRIMNADMAMEQVEASKYMILQQTSIAMLGQANQAPQFLLSLFR